jgi:hypothetical protein
MRVNMQNEKVQVVLNGTEVFKSVEQKGENQMYMTSRQVP